MFVEPIDLLQSMLTYMDSECIVHMLCWCMLKPDYGQIKKLHLFLEIDVFLFLTQKKKVSVGLGMYIYNMYIYIYIDTCIYNNPSQSLI